MTPSTSSNFAFLASHDARLAVLGTQAERTFAGDPNTCLLNLRQFGEVLAQSAAARLGLYTSPEDNQVTLLNRLRERGALDATTKQLFHDLRVAGSMAAHERHGDHHEALHQLKMARELAVWFQRSFGDNKKFDPGPFVPPADKAKEDTALAAELERLRGELARSLAADLAALQARAAAAPAAVIQTSIARAGEAAQAIHLDEAQTRRLIDEQLRDAGWEVDSARLHANRGTRPQKGRNLAIAEWPTDNGPADYVLFVGPLAMAVVEAKRKRKDVAGAIEQAKRYSRGFTASTGASLAGGPWGKDRYKVPFLFATNGRPYLEQIAEKSGIWFRDARRDDNHARALQGWYSPSGLTALLKQDIALSHDILRREPTDYLGLRDYQIRAIQAVEAAIEAGQPTCLVAMATGTGKTRTAIGLVYRLLKTKRFRRVLFLVDRTALGEQAADAFGYHKLENLQTFAQIFDIKGLEDIKPEPDTKLHIATVQGMVKRILDPGSPADVPPVDQYDCLVIDECHRGYGLDREMTDAELRYRDLDDYISKYRRVLDHFDAVKIGLTATPALHTTEIFGAPTFRYSYREAVIDGQLIDHEPPVRIITELGEQGIQWNKGDEVKVFDPKTQKIDLIRLDDEVKIDIDGFNRLVLTENWNRVVCAELAQQLDPLGAAKTLVFAANDGHADQIVRLLKKAFEAKYGSIDDDAVLKITGASDQPLRLIRRFKNERLPSVAVTVDLLTTGIDVPKITNLVFLRRVKSRILYEQMLGRATRLCPEIDKTIFRIFDAVDLYAALEPYTEMKPVVPAPNISFGQLVQELTTVTDAEARQSVLDQLIAKLQRRRQTLRDEELTRFEGIAEMSPRDLARMLKGGTVEQAAAWFRAHEYLVPVLDGAVSAGRPLLVSEHVDRLVGTETGYGKAKRPDDYLEGFTAFLRENLNKIPALVVVTQRPRDLTRAELKELQMALDAKGYTEAALQTAWREKTNADIAASIVGYIRQAALGDALMPYDERVDRAMKKIMASRSFTTPQRDWLRRIGAQLRKEKIVDRKVIDEGEAFKSHGGFKSLDKVFGGALEQILDDLREEIWRDAG